jgi:hypothetical protein
LLPAPRLLLQQFDHSVGQAVFAENHGQVGFAGHLLARQPGKTCVIKRDTIDVAPNLAPPTPKDVSYGSTSECS